MSYYSSEKGFTLIELIITVTIIGILAMIAIPAYMGQQQAAERTEAFQNLEALRLFEEQLFSETAAYAAAGTCGADQPQPDNFDDIQDVLPGFQPATPTNPRFSYCITLDEDFTGAATPNNCFRARAFGNDNTRVAGEVFAIDCMNGKNY